jgi:UDP-N-acetylmuramate-alanine ligase
MSPIRRMIRLAVSLAKAEILVVTNIDYDHPDVYSSIAEVQKAFLTFKKQQVGRKITIVNADDPLASHY